jgi:bisphosphoglycerate-independent phosphoglycerate mutase (AlkP superfamily)
LIVVSENKKISLKEDGRLANVAATCLDIAEFDIPDYFALSLIEVAT